MPNAALILIRRWPLKTINLGSEIDSGSFIKSETIMDFLLLLWIFGALSMSVREISSHYSQCFNGYCSSTDRSWFNNSTDARATCALNDPYPPTLTSQDQQDASVTFDNNTIASQRIGNTWTRVNNLILQNSTFDMKYRKIMFDDANRLTHAIIEDTNATRLYTNPSWDKKSYICGFPATRKPNPGDRSTCNRGLLYLNNTCYIANRAKATWFEARYQCLQSGGDLAVLDFSNSIQDFAVFRKKLVEVDSQEFATSFWNWTNVTETWTLLSTTSISSVPSPSTSISRQSTVSATTSIPSASNPIPLTVGIGVGVGVPLILGSLILVIIVGRQRRKLSNQKSQLTNIRKDVDILTHELTVLKRNLNIDGDETVENAAMQNTPVKVDDEHYEEIRHSGISLNIDGDGNVENAAMQNTPSYEPLKQDAVTVDYEHYEEIRRSGISLNIDGDETVENVANQSGLPYETLIGEGSTIGVQQYQEIFVSGRNLNIDGDETVENVANQSRLPYETLIDERSTISDQHYQEILASGRNLNIDGDETVENAANQSRLPYETLIDERSTISDRHYQEISHSVRRESLGNN